MKGRSADRPFACLCRFSVLVIRVIGTGIDFLPVGFTLRIYVLACGGGYVDVAKEEVGELGA